MSKIKFNGIDIDQLCQKRTDTNYGSVPAMKYFKRNGKAEIDYVKGTQYYVFTENVDIPIKLNGRIVPFDSIGVRPLPIVRAMDTSNNLKVYIQRASDGRVFRTLNNTRDSDFTIAPASIKLRGLLISQCGAGGSGGGSSGGSAGAGGGGGGAMLFYIKVPRNFVGVICRMDFSEGNAYLNWRDQTGIYLCTRSGGGGAWNNGGAGSAGKGFEEGGSMRENTRSDVEFLMGESGGSGGSAGNKGGDAMRMMMQCYPEDGPNYIFWNSSGGTGGQAGGSGGGDGGGGGASAWGNGATGASSGQNNGRNGGIGAGGSGGGAKTWTFTNRQGGSGGQAGIWYLY